MKKRVVILSLVIIVFEAFAPIGISAKRNSRKMKTPAETPQEYASGSFTVSSDCEGCHDGYSLSQIVFSGYDKPATSDYETFFVTNNTDRTLTGFSFYIIYSDMEQRELHKTFKTIDVEIPAGGTRSVRIRSWDVQKSFHYIKSRTSRRATSPYDVKIDPVTIRLRF